MHGVSTRPGGGLSTAESAEFFCATCRIVLPYIELACWCIGFGANGFPHWQSLKTV